MKVPNELDINRVSQRTLTDRIRRSEFSHEDCTHILDTTNQVNTLHDAPAHLGVSG